MTDAADACVRTADGPSANDILTSTANTDEIARTASNENGFIGE
ncbi:hypothetical protein RBSWK_05065 [Rhodopirellula baltica SWK14]|uniref:Uncharacterized protein n=1 Tax=Rhodopirellula baltica SWK14 TaxID=993516 RepID=L7CD98_RHOBT|nr:hypothetical protein RBSWK_05065 [Rhodopirellula baltica SWK14]